MKKILLSLGTIALVGVAVVGGTGAFFNDAETSTNNIFVAGAIDLKVDHTKQTYNGVDCKTCSVVVQSDTGNEVVATVGGADPVAFPHNAVQVTPTSVTNQHWTATVSNPNAKWIWATDPVLLADVQSNVTYHFENTFEWFGPFTGASVEFSIASDNSYKVFLNNTEIAADSVENNFGASDTVVVDLTPYITQGTNTLRFEVTNKAQPNGTVLGNPGGLLYSLEIDGNCEDNYFKQHCALFGETDLTDQVFWNFNDVKPGDTGTNVISLHVFDNDAYACLFTHDIENDDVSLAEPELDLADTPDLGELGQFIEVFGWHDANNNGTFENTEEVLIDSGTPFNQIPTEMIELSLVGNGPVDYVGLAWCFGDQTGPTVGDENEPLVCTSSVPNINIAQTDSIEASLTAYAVQQRNNSNFSCEAAFDELFGQ